ncbi:hypothetical protein SFR_6719 [Streptomyces sp. FR-008]|nr:hypothetical protein SFR_6719 [Streptomyces sp. FR-008]
MRRGFLTEGHATDSSDLYVHGGDRYLHTRS